MRTKNQIEKDRKAVICRFSLNCVNVVFTHKNIEEDSFNLNEVILVLSLTVERIMKDPEGAKEVIEELEKQIIKERKND